MTRLLAVVVALLFAGAAFAQSLEVVKVHKMDGTLVPGFVLEQRDDGLLIRSAGEDVFIPYAEINEVEYVGVPSKPTNEFEPQQPEPQQPEPQPVDSKPVEPELMEARPSAPPATASPSPIVGPTPQGAFRGSPGWAEYTRRRIVLKNMRGRAVGPAKLGYPARDFRRDDDEAYRADVGGITLSTAEFLELAADDRMAERFARSLERANIRVDFGFGMLALSGTLAGFGWPLAVGGNSTGDINAALIGPGLIGWSIATAVIAATLHRSGYNRIADFNDTDLEEMMDRRAAWPAVQQYNGRLRRELGVPDEPNADAEERTKSTPDQAE